jgi:hypothetical protein
MMRAGDPALPTSPMTATEDGASILSRADGLWVSETVMFVAPQHAPRWHGDQARADETRRVRRATPKTGKGRAA